MHAFAIAVACRVRFLSYVRCCGRSVSPLTRLLYMRLLPALLRDLASVDFSGLLIRYHTNIIFLSQMRMMFRFRDPSRRFHQQRESITAVINNVMPEAVQDPRRRQDRIKNSTLLLCTKNISSLLKEFSLTLIHSYFNNSWRVTIRLWELIIQNWKKLMNLLRVPRIGVLVHLYSMITSACLYWRDGRTWCYNKTLLSYIFLLLSYFSLFKYIMSPVQANKIYLQKSKP